MEVTSAMVRAAITKAREAGLLPRNCSTCDLKNSVEVMQTILQAALDTRTMDAGKSFPMSGALDKPATRPWDERLSD